MTHFEPPRAGRLADNDLGRARIAGKDPQPFDNARRWNGRGRGAKPRGERKRVGKLPSLIVRYVLATPRLDIHRAPWRLERVGKAFARADEFGGDRQFADRDDDAFADCKAAGQGMAAHMVEHLRIDRLRGAAERQFAERGQVRLGKEMGERAARFLRHVDLAIAQPLDQFVGRNIDDLDLGIFQNRIGHGFADADAGERRNDVVQAFDMLDVDRRIDVDPGAQQFLDILIALGVPAARRVAVRKLIDEHQLRPAFEDRVDVHFAKTMPLMIDRAARNDLMTVDECLGLAAAVGFDHADHDIDPGLAPLPAVGQHLPCLADARSRAEKHFQRPRPSCAAWRRKASGDGRSDSVTQRV